MQVSRYEAQQQVLSAAFFDSTAAMWQWVDPATMDEPFRAVAQAMRAVSDRGKHVDLDTLTAECSRRGVNASVDRWLLYPIPLDTAASVYADASARVTIEQAFLRGSQQIAEGADHWDVADDVASTVGLLSRPSRGAESYAMEWSEVTAMEAEEEQWVLPGLLSRNERCVLTGKEGHGKSLLVYQLLLGAAFGVSPMDGVTRFPRKRVLVLDVENTGPQIGAHFRTLSAAYRPRSAEPTVNPEVRLMRNHYIDLTRVGDRRRIIDAANDYHPDLMFLGSGYRLADGTQDHRVIAMSIQQTVDQIRADTECAVVIEMHAGHGFQNDRNGWRPDGSSYWMRWPEFGLGMDPVVVRKGRLTRLVKWRGDRITGREWPDGFRSGGVLPWLPVEEAEIELAR